MKSKDYDPDEALRICEVAVHLEGEEYLFRVHNNAHKFTLILVEHRISSNKIFVNDDDYVEAVYVACKHTNEREYPCTVTAEDIKDAARRSIAEHKRRFHSLKLVSQTIEAGSRDETTVTPKRVERVLASPRLKPVHEWFMRRKLRKLLYYELSGAMAKESTSGFRDADEFESCLRKIKLRYVSIGISDNEFGNVRKKVVRKKL